MNKDQLLVELYRYALDTSAWKTPTVIDCSRFVMQEAAEVDSSLMKAGYQEQVHVRNNPMNVVDARKRTEEEIGQLYVMVLTLANLIDVDLHEAGRHFLDAMYIKYVGKIDSDRLQITKACVFELLDTKRVTYVQELFETLKAEQSSVEREAAKPYVDSMPCGETEHACDACTDHGACAEVVL